METINCHSVNKIIIFILEDYNKGLRSYMHLWLILRLVWIFKELKYTQGMQVTSTGPQTIQKAEGESVILGCTYTPSPADTGELDIEWSVVSPDTTQKDQMVRSWIRMMQIQWQHGMEYNYHNNLQTFHLSFKGRGDSGLLSLIPMFSCEDMNRK